MIRTALFFGSFNPIHLGHTSIAGAVLQRGLCDELWLVVSPQNPLKDPSLIIDGGHRLRMAAMAAEAVEGVSVCDVEFSMPVPSYTIDTLRALSARYPDRRFTVVMGSDSAACLDRWKDYRDIIEDYGIVVYPRRGYDVPNEFAGRFSILDGVDTLDVSSTEIRDALVGGGDVSGMLAWPVEKYILDNGLWGVSALDRLSRRIGMSPDDAALYLARGVEYQRLGMNDRALNDFIRAAALDPANTEAVQRADMLRSIFDFAYRDIYNP